MVRFGKSCLGANEHSLPFLNPQGDKILGLGCHELDKGVITRRVHPHAPDRKSILSIPLGHPIPDRNIVRRFLDRKLDFKTIFNLTKLFYLFCSKIPNLLDLALLTCV